MVGREGGGEGEEGLGGFEGEGVGGVEDLRGFVVPFFADEEEFQVLTAGTEAGERVDLGVGFGAVQGVVAVGAEEGILDWRCPLAAPRVGPDVETEADVDGPEGGVSEMRVVAVGADAGFSPGVVGCWWFGGHVEDTFAEGAVLIVGQVPFYGLDD